MCALALPIQQYARMHISVAYLQQYVRRHISVILFNSFFNFVGDSK